MNHFKNRSIGFSFIETMIAITLLSIFGSSIFLVQTNLFSKILKTHLLVQDSFDIDHEILNFHLKIQQALLKKESPESVKYETTKTYPDRKITFTCKPIDQKSSLYKNFSNNVYIIQATIFHSQTTTKWHSFFYASNNSKNQETT